MFLATRITRTRPSDILPMVHLPEFIPTEHFLQAAENDRTCLLQKLQLLGILDTRKMDDTQKRRFRVIAHEVRIRLSTRLQDQCDPEEECYGR